jgi:hypothetical protein
MHPSFGAYAVSSKHSEAFYEGLRNSSIRASLLKSAPLVLQLAYALGNMTVMLVRENDRTARYVSPVLPSLSLSASKVSVTSSQADTEVSCFQS